jgi:hypothetical protein
MYYNTNVKMLLFFFQRQCHSMRKVIKLGQKSRENRVERREGVKPPPPFSRRTPPPLPPPRHKVFLQHTRWVRI